MFLLLPLTISCKNLTYLPTPPQPSLDKSIMQYSEKFFRSAVCLSFFNVKKRDDPAPLFNYSTIFAGTPNYSVPDSERSPLPICENRTGRGLFLSRYSCASPKIVEYLKNRYTVSSAWATSAMRSSVSSRPHERRTISGAIPAAASSSSFIWRCVALAGCSTQVRASAT